MVLVFLGQVQQELPLVVPPELKQGLYLSFQKKILAVFLLAAYNIAVSLIFYLRIGLDIR